MKANSKVLCILLFTGFSFFMTKSQTKIVLFKGVKRVELWKGQKLMPVFDNDTAKYEYWRNSCKTCSQLPTDSIWEIDSISASGDLILKHIISYQYDTITVADWQLLARAERKEYDKKWELDTVIYDLKNWELTKYVYKKPGSYAKLATNINHLKALRFAVRYTCEKNERGFPIGSMFIGVADVTLGVWYFINYFPPPTRYAVVLVSGIAAVVIGISQLTKYKVKTYDLKKWAVKIKTRKY